MNELIAKIKELSEALLVDAAAQAEKGNKAAGTRARKASLDLEKYETILWKLKKQIYTYFLAYAWVHRESLSKGK